MPVEGPYRLLENLLGVGTARDSSQASGSDKRCDPPDELLVRLLRWIQHLTGKPSQAPEHRPNERFTPPVPQ